MVARGRDEGIVCATGFQKKSVPSCKTPFLPSTYTLAFQQSGACVDRRRGQSLKEAYSVITGALQMHVSKERGVFLSFLVFFLWLRETRRPWESNESVCVCHSQTDPSDVSPEHKWDGDCSGPRGSSEEADGVARAPRRPRCYIFLLLDGRL